MTLGSSAPSPQIRREAKRAGFSRRMPTKCAARAVPLAALPRSVHARGWPRNKDSVCLKTPLLREPKIGQNSSREKSTADVEKVCCAGLI
jgi:hypothetical protein